MNKHFEDTRYYLKRAGETAKQGIQEEVEPLQERVQRIIGEEEEPEPGRVEKLRADLKEVGERAEGEAKEAIGEAREKVTQYRDERSD
jgi:uncharacterized protein YjbJ (UPF0337 family)